MSTKTIIKPTVQNYELTLSRTKITLGDIVETNPIDQVSASVPITYDHAYVADEVSVIDTPAEDHASPVILEVGYRPEVFGDDNSQAVITAMSDFYNKVIGSALQATSISYADLTIYVWIGKEFRAMIKDIDRVLNTYNEVCYINPAFGKKLITAMTGSEAVYSKVVSYSAALIKLRNQLGTRINKYFPQMKGLLWGAIDDLALDNVYCDDPDAKGALIVFHRNGYTVRHSTNGGLATISPLEFWTELARVDVSPDFTIDTFCDDILNKFDVMMQDIWFVDVRPFIENLITKGGFYEDAGIAPLFEDKPVNREWAPVYSTQVIDLIKNAHICSQGVYNEDASTKGISGYADGTTIHEDANGRVVTLFGLQPALYSGARTKSCVSPNTRIKNLEEYPASEQSLLKAIAFEALIVSDSNSKLRIAACGPAVITYLRYTFEHKGEEHEILLTSNALLGLGAVSDGYVSQVKTECFQTTTSWNISLVSDQDIQMLSRFNAVPRLSIIYPSNIAELVNAFVNEDEEYVFNYITGGNCELHTLSVDIDNLVPVPLSMYRNAFRLMAYEGCYNPDAISGTLGKR